MPFAHKERAFSLLRAILAYHTRSGPRASIHYRHRHPVMDHTAQGKCAFGPITVTVKATSLPKPEQLVTPTHSACLQTGSPLLRVTADSTRGGFLLPDPRDAERMTTSWSRAFIWVSCTCVWVMCGCVCARVCVCV